MPAWQIYYRQPRIKGIYECQKVLRDLNEATIAVRLIAVMSGGKSLCGWVQRQRDLGQLIFVDLRDRTGIVQLAFDDTTDE